MCKLSFTGALIGTIKTNFKKFEKLVYFSNCLQSVRTKLFYRFTLIIKTYFSRSKPDRKLKTLNKTFNELNILFLGTDYQQDHSGMLQAVSKFGTVVAFTKTDGSYGLTPSNSISSLNAFAENTARIMQLCDQLQNENLAPDIILGQMWGCSFDTSILNYLYETYGTISISIAMDDRHTFWGGWFKGRQFGSSGVSPYVNLALTAAPEAVKWYQKEGCPALFFPEASDPTIFYPMPDLPKIHDVSFVGACYGIRKKIVDALRAAGIQVTTYGNGWGTGRLDIAEVPKLFAQSKIILGVGTIGHCDDFYALKLRDFDAPISGSFYITNDNPDLNLLFKVGEEIETYKDVDDCVRKIKYYLTHDEEREKVARQGLVRALKDHTWEIRFKTVFDMLRSH